MKRLLIPGVDIWCAAFDRQTPDPLVVHAFTEATRERRVYCVGWIRQQLVARVRDPRHRARFTWLIGGFGDVQITTRDHLAAAERTSLLRERNVVISPWQAALWELCDRISADIWTHDRSWLAMQRHGAPVVSTPG